MRVFKFVFALVTDFLCLPCISVLQSQETRSGMKDYNKYRKLGGPPRHGQAQRIPEIPVSNELRAIVAEIVDSFECL